MDAKTKADFINSVATGEVVYCQKCGKQNKPYDKFFVACGTKLRKREAAARERLLEIVMRCQTSKPLLGAVQTNSLLVVMIFLFCFLFCGICCNLNLLRNRFTFNGCFMMKSRF